MNKNLQEALDHQKLRNQMKNILLEKKLTEQDLYSAFVEPFADVIKAANLATQDIVSGAMVILGTTLLSFSPKLQQKRLDNFDKRYEAIGKEWEPIMKSADEALSAGDADLLALVYAPGVYALSALGAGSYNAAEGIGSYLDNLGLKKGFLSLLPGVSISSVDSGSSGSSSSSSSDSGDEGKPLIDKLILLFMGAAAAGEYIKYKEKDQTPQKESTVNSLKILREEKKGDFLSDFRDWIKGTGLASEFEETQENIYSAFETLIKSYNDEVRAKVSVIDAVKNSDNIEQFVESLKKIESKGIDLKGAPSELMDEISQGAERMAASQEFRDKVDAQGLDQNYEDVARKSVFEDFRDKFIKTSDEKIKDMKLRLGKDLQERMPSDKVLKMISKTPAGIKLTNLLQVAKSEYIDI